MWPPVVKPPDSIASKFPSAPSPSPTVTVTQFVSGWQGSTSLVSRHGLLFQAATPFCISATQSAGTSLVSKVMTTLAAPFRLQGTWESSGSWSCKAAPAGATQASADDGEGEEVRDGDAVGEAAAGLVCAGVTEGASAEVGPGSGESADVHDTSAESARTSATASRPVRRTMLPNLPPDISTRAGFDQPAPLPQGAVGAHCTPGGGSRVASPANYGTAASTAARLKISSATIAAAPAMPAPTTTTSGLSRLTAVDSTSPRARPAAVTTRTASGLPSRTRSTTSRVVTAGCPSRSRSRTIARPLAMAARQPRAPQLLQVSVTPGILACPMSPSAESEPRSSAPSMTTDEPTPVPTLTKTTRC